MTRADLETAVERAIALLNAWDGDEDFESECEDEGAQCDDEGCDDENREPSLCGTLGECDHAVGPGTSGVGSYGEMSFDLEMQCDDEGFEADREPTLAHLTLGPSDQTAGRWISGSLD